MKRSCRASPWLLAVLIGCACATERAPVFAERDPRADQLAPRASLPRDAERLAAELASAAFASDRMRVTELRAKLEAEYPRSGLCDDAHALELALAGSAHELESARTLLERRDLEPALRARAERALAADPLEVAARRLAEERRYRLGAIWNRLAEPASRAALSGIVNPIDATRSVISALLSVHQFPTATPRERQVLRAWHEFLTRHPDDARAPSVAASAAELERKLAAARWRRTLEQGETLLAEGQPEAALALALRNDRAFPGDSETAALRTRAARAAQIRTNRVRESLHAAQLGGESLESADRERLASLVRAVAAAPLGNAAARARAWQSGGAPASLASELGFVASLGRRASGDADTFTRAQLALARTAGPMQRHSLAWLTSPDENPWSAYQAARTSETRALFGFVLLGRHAHGPARRELPRVLEHVLDLPSLATSLLTFPLRVLQIRSARTRIEGPVLAAGERYLARLPNGAHALELSQELERRYARRGQPQAALRLLEARETDSPKQRKRYRDAIAARLLESARAEPRIDLRLALLRELLATDPDSATAHDARVELDTARASATPQRIRLARAFLVEHPELWGPGALGLRAELLDGKRANGELGDDGVTLLGGRAIELAFASGEPRRALVPERDFSRFAAALEETHYASLQSDPTLAPDPLRDAFLEGARLGDLAPPSPRASARSAAVYDSQADRLAKRRSERGVLPVDLVLQGDLDTLGLSAFPRVREPVPTPDAVFFE